MALPFSIHRCNMSYLIDQTLCRVYGYEEGCPACDKIKQLLEKHRISYTFVPVSQDCPHRKWLFKQGHQTVPQVYCDSTYVGDYASLKRHFEDSNQ